MGAVSDTTSRPKSIKQLSCNLQDRRNRPTEVTIARPVSDNETEYTLHTALSEVGQTVGLLGWLSHRLLHPLLVAGVYEFFAGV